MTFKSFDIRAKAIRQKVRKLQWFEFSEAAFFLFCQLQTCFSAVKLSI